MMRKCLFCLVVVMAATVVLSQSGCTAAERKELAEAYANAGYGDYSGGTGGGGSLVGGGFYDDGSYGNWLTGTYVSSSGGSTAIQGDGFSCLDGECW